MPYKWKHAQLGDIKLFLESEAKKGMYKPIFEL